MKKKMVPSIVCLMLFGAWTVVGAQTSSVQIGPYGNLKIGPYGNLVGMTDTQGKDVFSQISEGYEIAYRVKNSKGNSEERRLYAVSDQPAQGLTTQNTRSTDSAKVVITEDKTLEITSQFTYDETAQQLIIVRRVKNVSGGAVDLQTTREYLDSQLLVGRQPQTKQPNLEQLALARIRAGRCIVCDCSRSGKCTPPPPPCSDPFCPGLRSYLPPQVVTGPSGARFIMLQWREGMTSASRRPDATTIAPKQELHYVFHLQLN